MHAFAFELYILSLLVVSKYHAAATDVDAEKLSASVPNQQTTDSKDGKEQMPRTDDAPIKGKFSPLEQCIF